MTILDNNKLNNHDKKKNNIEKQLNPISNTVSDQLVSVGTVITDFNNAGDDVVDAFEDNAGVAVEFDDDGKSEVDVIQEDNEEEYDGNAIKRMRICGVEACKKLMRECRLMYTTDIDVFWLQRKISQAYEQRVDPQDSQKLAEEVNFLF
ncbi:putative brr2 helicase PWI domain-containing protein [Helianthus annuus]|nr:putative brr2 helicase PWI domain-containing protein [Helianthus annuus]